MEVDIPSEIQHIVDMALSGQARLVMLESFVLFSTDTQDAWLLDSEDNFALCLLRDGERQPYRILDTPTTFAIDWPAKFEISDGEFVIIHRTGKVTSIFGYPTEQIADACRGRMS